MSLAADAGCGRGLFADDAVTCPTGGIQLKATRGNCYCQFAPAGLTVTGPTMHRYDIKADRGSGRLANVKVDQQGDKESGATVHDLRRVFGKTVAVAEGATEVPDGLLQHECNAGRTFCSRKVTLR